MVVFNLFPFFFFFFQAEDGIRDVAVTGVQTCALPISSRPRSTTMASVKLIEYAAATAEVRAVYDDIIATRKTDSVNNFWKALASHPPTLRRTWETLKSVMAPGALDLLTKEMVYLAVSATNGCDYCIVSHTASARRQGMTDEMLGELMAVVGMANETNRLANGDRKSVVQGKRV